MSLKDTQTTQLHQPEIHPRAGRVFTPSDTDQLKQLPEPIEFETLDTEALSVLAEDKKNKTQRALRRFGIFSGLFILFTSGSFLYQQTQAAMEQHWLLGGALLLLSGGIAVSVSSLLWRWLKGRRSWQKVLQLKQQTKQLQRNSNRESGKQYLQDLNRFYHKKPQASRLAGVVAELPDYLNQQELLDRIDRQFVALLDAEAESRIRRYSGEIGLAVALSPWAKLDMLVVFWRSLKMIDEICKVYGIYPGTLERLRLLRQLFGHVILAGTTEVATEIMVGTGILDSLPGRLAARASQGLGVTALSVRLGYSCMSLCRPISTDKKTELAAKSMVKALGSQLVAKLISRGKSESSE